MKAMNVRLGEFLSQVAQTEPVDQATEYRTLGVRNHSKGAFDAGVLKGADTKYKTIRRFYAGQVIYGKLMAWEGGMAIVPTELDGRYASTEFVGFDINQSIASVGYVRHLIAWQGFRRLAGSGSAGTNVRRQRLQPTSFLNLEVPLPSRPDQDRIAAHLDSIAAKTTLAAETAVTANAALRALREQALDRIADAGSAPLSQVLTQVDQTEIVDPDKTYRMLGARAWGRGAFASGTIQGSSTKYPKLRRLKAGQVCYPKLMGWQGAFAVVQSDLDGYFASPEFVAFDVDVAQISIDYLGHVIGTTAFWEAAATLASGTNANRRRLQPSDFIAIPVPLPDLTTQSAVATALNTAARGATTAGEAAGLAASLLPAARNEIFGVLTTP